MHWFTGALDSRNIYYTLVCNTPTENSSTYHFTVKSKERNFVCYRTITFGRYKVFTLRKTYEEKEQNICL